MDLSPSLWCQVAALNRLTGSTSLTTCLAPGADGSLCVGHGSQLSTYDWTLHLQQSITTNLPQVAACVPAAVRLAFTVFDLPLAGLETAADQSNPSSRHSQINAARLSCATQSQCTGMPAQQITRQLADSCILGVPRPLPLSSTASVFWLAASLCISPRRL